MSDNGTILDGRRGPGQDAAARVLPRPAATFPLLAACLLGGLGLGVLSRLGDRLPGAASWIANLAALWLLAAFALGARAASRRAAGGAGAVGLAAAVLGYYAFMRVIEHEANLAYAQSFVPKWGAIALLAGGVFGAAGATWRRDLPPGKTWAVGSLAAALVGEALFFLARGAHGASVVAFALELVLGLAAPAVLLRRPRQRVHAYGVLFVLTGLAVVALVLASAVVQSG